jgi:hypothetical protein
MKNTVITILLCSCLFDIVTAENAIYEACISQLKSDPSIENLIVLGGHLRGAMRHRYSYRGNTPYSEILRDTMLSIPNHARYFADEIKREQKEVATYGKLSKNEYDFHRALHFETLSHLPSPETIAVLGHFLADDVDKPRERISPNSDWGENPRANSSHSAYTIIDIGLRNPPVSPLVRQTIDPDQCLALTRTWWEEVKSGRSSFSFKGQKVEYRFNPDGTWETLALTNPPDDVSDPTNHIPNKTECPTKREPLNPQINRPSEAWKWIAACLVILIVVGFGRMKKNLKNG